MYTLYIFIHTQARTYVYISLSIYIPIYLYIWIAARAGGQHGAASHRPMPNAPAGPAGAGQRERGALCRRGGCPRRSRVAEPRRGRVRLPKRSARRRFSILSSGEMLSDLGRGSPCHSLPIAFFPAPLQHFSSTSLARINFFRYFIF